MNTALKRHGWLRDGNGLISLKAILKYRHGSLPQSKLSRELAQASCNHEVPWKNQCGASRVFESRGFPCQKICDNPINNYICDNLWIKNVGRREMLKASGGNVKCLWNSEKS